MREAGILLHITSLPSKYGCGSLGKEAYKFVDFLAKSGQKIWQILPIGPTSYGDSPYSSTSAFAYNPYFIDLDMLVEWGLILKEDLPAVRETQRCDFNALYNERFKIYHKAYQNKDLLLDEFESFKASEAYWLDDYAAYMLIKDIQGGRPWYEWDDSFKYRDNNTMNWVNFDPSNKDKLDEVRFIQFLFYKQFVKLKAYANKKGVSIMGDMPIYCAHDSADVWANPKYFYLNESLTPKAVAGCPPDFFSEDGQLWGNPLYDWDFMRNDKYSFWIKRVKHSFVMFDILRIDHFRGFAGYYSIPYGDINAKGGHWEVGPGIALFKEIEKNIGKRRIIAEDLGFLTKDVFKLLKDTGYPGMHIFQFELGDLKKVPLKKGFKENKVFYTGTHDNSCIMSFYNSLSSKALKIVNDLCGIDIYSKPNFKIIEFAMNSNCNTVIIPMQDYLGLSDLEGRMNMPSTISKSNWSYMARYSDFSNDLSKYILKITKESSR